MDAYKGVRDFYPEDERIQNYIFHAMRSVVETFGYEEMNASILEATELYTTKTSEEIVQEQTYTFTDRGGRSVTMRPEMTPTVARMVGARKRELGYPLRWYSIQNFFRYERTQRGREREFWQLNADLFGVPGVEADIELIEIAYRIMRALGAADSMFEIRVSSRKLLEEEYGSTLKEGITPLQMFRLLDKKEKLPKDEFEREWQKISTGAFTEISIKKSADLSNLLKKLQDRGVLNATISPYTVRGFDYYTDIVFEVFDTASENNRSLFGGGRYDSLIEKYAGESVPAVGFAMGDVTARNFLETHELLPSFSSTTDIYLAPLTKNDTDDTAAYAEKLRAKGVKVALGMKHEKIADHIKAALKLGIPNFAVFGEEEKKNKIVKVKFLSKDSEEEISFDSLAEHLLKRHT